jgi:hypothetical protein
MANALCKLSANIMWLYFDQHLKGQDAPLLDGTDSDDPEVVFDTI